MGLLLEGIKNIRTSLGKVPSSHLFWVALRRCHRGSLCEEKLGLL